MSIESEYNTFQLSKISEFEKELSKGENFLIKMDQLCNKINSKLAEISHIDGNEFLNSSRVQHKNQLCYLQSLYKKADQQLKKLKDEEAEQMVVFHKYFK